MLQEQIVAIRDRLQPGKSIFVEGARNVQITSLRQALDRSGVDVSIWHTHRDPIHHRAGIRILRNHQDGETL